MDLTITHTITKQGKETKPSSEVIHTNKKHPFLTVEKGFLPVGQIKLGMHVVEADGQVGVISGWKVVPGVQTMYNLEVAQDHTFVVGVGMWVVHNCNRGALRSAVGAGPGEQAHHIIPCACENHSVVQAAQGLGFNIDGASNGVALATDSTVASARNEVSHLGPHSVYTQYIWGQLTAHGAQIGGQYTAMHAVQDTIQEGLQYMNQLATTSPGIRLF